VIIGATVITFAGQRWLIKYLKRLPIALSKSQAKIVDFLSSLLNEFIIVIFVLMALFWLATWQAKDDAWKDAVNETSALPIVTIVMPQDASLGRKLNNPLESRSTKTNLPNFRIIGDLQSYKRLLDNELNDISNPDKPRIWRLLLKGNGYSYIFPALPKKEAKLTFPVVIVYERDNGVQLTILNSSISQP
jgi:hypothetical protein